MRVPYCTGQCEERYRLKELVKEHGKEELSLAKITTNPLLWDLAHRVYKRHREIGASGLETR